MIEPELKADLERITGLNAYPLNLPSDKLEGVIYQRISDPKIATGLAKTSLVQARFQITIQIPNDYIKALKLGKKILAEWENITHGHIGNYPVQAVQRGNFMQNREEQTEGRVIYRVMRDFIITYAEAPDD
ncbi:hypothetical protein [Xenorhabdus kozodoii]|uniref:Uncharacterized protein n=1 Tax=Xenorhabdus kozodoii TaxID=351676 RepID=A0A2D0KXH0_9GAMM|nr:hypothetical protein [Xenorhabdus kozodoii]PHM68134.1 hypothetical protein Xkoz_03746 [Xenorhabdus kozodoii]